MRTLLRIVVIFSILSVSTLFTTLNNNGAAYAICSELDDPNISCHEQYNSHSNTATSTLPQLQLRMNPILCSART